ncbi:two-component system sensor histidine kinase UczS [Craurococcus roseus]|uniref:histidine kinase n=1 Tax=Craurococcus roseus TaxID=77585 RepID=A0ABN1F3G6_9PROT
MATTSPPEKTAPPPPPPPPAVAEPPAPGDDAAAPRQSGVAEAVADQLRTTPAADAEAPSPGFAAGLGARAGALRPPGLFRSAGFRFAALFAALFAAASLVLVGALWLVTAGTLDRQTDMAIRSDALALVERFREGGTTGLVEAIEERLAVDVENDSIYLLVTADTDRRLAGNLNRWPVAWHPTENWFRTRVVHDGAETQARLYKVELPELRLLVGRDDTERQRLQQLLTEGALSTSGLAGSLAFFGAWLMRRAMQARMRPAFATAAAISAGDLSQRVPLSGRDDEFDRLAATMNTMLDRIETLMDGVRGVSDAIAHDLRTPIARARAKLEEALANAGRPSTPEGAALRRAVERGIADLDGIARIFRALLRIAEAEAGARRAAFAAFDLAPVLADAGEIYEAAAEARGLRLATDLPETLELSGDRDLLLQAVANLLDNAIKFTPPGGEVRLSAAVVETADGGAGIEVAVEDDGPGMASADRERAGQRFFRADEARATPGSGLGLALVQAVAGLHRGELVLEDANSDGAPRGLRAVLRLPLS